MAVEVIIPAEYLGDGIGDLNRRRGVVRGQGQRGTAATIEAAGAAEGKMFGYIGSLRALSSGARAVLDAAGPLWSGAREGEAALAR